MERFLNSLISISVSMSGDMKRSDRSPADAFLEALDGLSRSRIDLMEKGIEAAKHRLTLIMNQVLDDRSLLVNSSPSFEGLLNLRSVRNMTGS